MGWLDTAASKGAQKLLIEDLKRGKTDEQKKVIDFFLLEQGCISGCVSGCLGRKQISLMEYNQMVANRLNGLNLRERAIEKIGLDESEIEEIPPIVMNGFCFLDDDAYIKIEDDTAVASRFAVSWIFFSATQIYTYTYKFDMTSDDVWETTRDFFYQDITSFTTEQKIVERIDNLLASCIRKGIEAQKHNYRVDTIQIVVPNDSYRFAMRNSGNLEQSIQAAKSMLRERKFVK